MRKVIATMGILSLMALLLLRFSPHGGIVPVWKDTTGKPKRGGGNGSSYEEAITITGKGREIAKGYEIYFLWKMGHTGISFTNYTVEEIVTNGQTYHIVPVNGKPIYFNVTKLK